MAKVRKFVSYRRLERAYTRKSKYRDKSFIRASPVCKVIRFNMGDKAHTRQFGYKLTLNTKSALQIRDISLESARLTCNRKLENTLGKEAYRFNIRVYPHHYLRQNALASGAGADRLSTGMKHAFGKVIGRAAQISKGQTVFEVFCDTPNLAVAREALGKAAKKLPCALSIETFDLAKVTAN